jgi:hypothetical protein
MKTLIYTSIYSNLWGTEYGGRPSRGLHYKYSLLNILNLNPDKVICFTSESEYDDLRNWFIIENQIPEEKFELKIFELQKSKYFEKIKKLKNFETMKTLDRCYEVQYNKFFWVEEINDLLKYDKIYWFDAGLSHGGMFPEQYAYGSGLERYYNFNIFTELFLKNLNKITEDKLVIVSKNNTGKFYWSTTIPHNYYDEYNNSEHIIGGFFGGNLVDYLIFVKKFDKLLTELLDNEQELYYEELIMSCLYQNNKKDFLTLKFDDWYIREHNKDDKSISYFYQIFETETEKTNTCITTLSIDIKNNNNYFEKTKKLIETYLNHTNFDILVLTNNVNYFEDLKCTRLILIDYDSNFTETKVSGQMFNMHLKRLPIKLGMQKNYEIVYYHDGDCFIDGWDQSSFIEKCSEEFDVAFVSHANPQLGGLRRDYAHFQYKVDNDLNGLYFEELDNSPNPAETRVIFKNNDKLNKFIEFWDLISENNKDYNTYHDGVYFGTSAVYAKMKMIGVTPNDNFTNYCKIQHADKILNYFGNPTFFEEKKNEIVQNTEKKLDNDNSNHNEVNEVFGSFLYKDLSVLQHPNVKEKFNHLLSEKKPSYIIEIGTEFGGLTLILKDLIEELNLDTKIFTFDIKPIKSLVEHPEFNDKIKVIKTDLFYDSPKKLTKKSISLLNEMTINGLKIILCDGSKPSEEFNALCEILNEGDIIMLHDYVKNEEEFELNYKNKIWNWHESKYSEIEKSIIKNNLVPYMEENFSSVVWGCFEKN